VLILVNPLANAGRGAERWAQVERELRARGVAFEARFPAGPRDLPRHLDGHRTVVAAGGDGTVNAVLNAIMGRDLTLGAIGLGSSNDFHKPLALERMMAGVPARIDAGRARLADVGKAVLHGPDGGRTTRYFLLNASLGFVAEGNAFFNSEESLLLWLKRRSVEAAILYAALVNLWRLRPLRLSLGLDGSSPEDLSASSLGVLKRVHFAGAMRYDTPVAPDDGLFAVNLWEPMGRGGILRTLFHLYRGRFQGLPRTRSWRAKRVELVPERPVPFELDGEVTTVARAELEVVPRALRVCS